jgi:hypothetical protein
MKLCGLRPNVADSSGCSTVAALIDWGVFFRLQKTPAPTQIAHVGAAEGCDLLI